VTDQKLEKEGALQQESPWNQNGTLEMNYIYSLTGKYPAIRGMDYGDSQNWSTRAIPWWQAGGIDMVSYHMGAPGQPIDGYTGALLTADINAVLTPGTSQYQSFISRLDGSASELAKAQAAGVPIISRSRWHLVLVEQGRRQPVRPPLEIHV
jgi:hypothetical protein